MNDAYVRNRQGKIIGRFDGNWLRDGTGKLVAKYDAGVILKLGAGQNSAPGPNDRAFEPIRIYTPIYLSSLFPWFPSVQISVNFNSSANNLAAQLVSLLEERIYGRFIQEQTKKTKNFVVHPLKLVCPASACVSASLRLCVKIAGLNQPRPTQLTTRFKSGIREASAHFIFGHNSMPV